MVSHHKTVVFDHLPKCGGTSINSYLTTVFPNRYTYGINGADPHNSVKKFMSLAAKKRHRYKLVYGHQAYKLLDFTDPGSIRATVFREPVDRIISHYYFVKREKEHYLHEKIESDNIQLDEYCYHDLSGELQNYYVTRFTGLSIAEVEKDPEKSVKLAMKNIVETYHVIGFQENIPLFITDLKRAANIDVEFKNEFLNQTKSRVTVNQLDNSVVEKIATKNALDIELFNRLYSLRTERL